MFSKTQHTEYNLTIHPLTRKQTSKRIADWQSIFNSSLDELKYCLTSDYFPEEYTTDRKPSENAVEEVVKLTTHMVTMLRGMGVTPEELRRIEERVRTKHEMRGLLGDETCGDDWY
jgi:hypothetical protein|nr:MAG TPA: hypothetical protein [Caudoviricetes sp.]